MEKFATIKLNQDTSERDLLGTLLCMPEEITTLETEYHIDVNSFYSEANQEIFQGLLEYLKVIPGSIGVDTQKLRQCIKGLFPHTLVSEVDLNALQKHGQKKIDLAIDPIRAYAVNLIRLNRNRNIASLGEKLCETALDPKYILDSEFYGVINQQLQTHMNNIQSDEPLTSSAKSEMDSQYFKMTEGEEIYHQPLGMKKLDAKIGGGCSPGSTVIIAARPGCGKTSLMLNIAENLIEDQSTEDRPVVFFSLEMTKANLAEKMLCSYAEKSSFEIRNNNSEEIHQRLVGRIKKAFYRNGKLTDTFLLCDKASVSLAEIDNELKRLKDKHGGITAVFIDYLQLMKASGKHESRNYELGAISRQLREMAKKYSTTFFIACQLNRQIESDSKFGSGEMAPKNSFLRDSGAIEQDADVIIFLTRSIECSDESPIKTIFLHITKNRFGTITAKPITLEFNGAISQFKEMTTSQFSGYFYNPKGPSEYQGN